MSLRVKVPFLTHIYECSSLGKMSVGIVPPRTKSPTEESHRSSAEVSRPISKVCHAFLGFKTFDKSVFNCGYKLGFQSLKPIFFQHFKSLCELQVQLYKTQGLLKQNCLHTRAPKLQGASIPDIIHPLFHLITTNVGEITV